jgi:hypothetical protein
LLFTKAGSKECFASCNAAGARFIKGTTGEDKYACLASCETDVYYTATGSGDAAVLTCTTTTCADYHGLDTYSATNSRCETSCDSFANLHFHSEVSTDKVCYVACASVDGHKFISTDGKTCLAECTSG